MIDLMNFGLVSDFSDDGSFIWLDGRDSNERIKQEKRFEKMHIKAIEQCSELVGIELSPKKFGSYERTLLEELLQELELNTDREAVTVHNIDKVHVVLHSLSYTMVKQPQLKVELLPPYYIENGDHLIQLVEIYKQMLAHEKQRSFTYALTEFYRKLLNKFRTEDHEVDGSPT